MSSTADWAELTRLRQAREARNAKFFIPGVEDDEQAEGILGDIAKKHRRPTPGPDERLRRIAYEHNGETFVAEVAQPVDPYYYDHSGLVIAILPGQPLFVVTEQGKGIPVGHDSVKTTKFFGEPDPH